jgi:7-cyano-7-deazaguanine reductase
MLNASLLGKKTDYSGLYSAELLLPIARAEARQALGLVAGSELPFHGVDLWTGYEISWLDRRGKPTVAVALFSFPIETPSLIESKSFKLYLNSFNNSHFDGLDEVHGTLSRDLSRAAGGAVHVQVLPQGAWQESLSALPGINLDDLPVTIDTYAVSPSLLSTTAQEVQETLTSDLLKSNCPVTLQPDWASILVRYEGKQIDRAGLLKYIVSFRNHAGFHEQCVEQIFLDLLKHCQPNRLTVYARYTRRGGLDINPFRSNFEAAPHNCRNFRQ